MMELTREDVVLISNAMFDCSNHLNCAYNAFNLLIDSFDVFKGLDSNEKELLESYLYMIYDQLVSAKLNMDIYVDPNSSVVKSYFNEAKELATVSDLFMMRYNMTK